MVRVVLEGKEKVDLEEILKSELKDDKELSIREVYTKEGRFVVYMYEKFYLRINSELSVTVFYQEDKESSKVELIASGGSVGLLSTSYGAEERALEDTTAKLVELGFAITEQTK